jgi:hypothetical protein
MLRAAGLLPENEPRHHVVAGQYVPAQPELVSQVFGSPETVDDRTLIAVSSLRYVSGLAEAFEERLHEVSAQHSGYQDPAHRIHVAVIEVSDTGVQIVVEQRKMPMVLAALSVLIWNLYWVVRSLRK